MYKRQITEQEQQIMIEKKIAKFLQEVAALPSEQQPTQAEISLAIHNLCHETLTSISKYNEYAKAYNETFEIPGAKIEWRPSEFDKEVADIGWRAMARSSDKKIAAIACRVLART